VLTKEDNMNKLCCVFLLMIPIFNVAISWGYYNTGQDATLVIGQSNMNSNNSNQGGGIASNGFSEPFNIFIANNSLLVSDTNNNRVLIFNSVPVVNNASANFVIGQPDMLSGVANQGTFCSGKTLNFPNGILYAANKLFIADFGNNRILVYNSIPGANNTQADYVIGQPNLTSNSSGCTANSLRGPQDMYSDGTRLFIADRLNSRVLIFNSIPAVSNTPANIVIGQQNMTGGSANQGGTCGSNTLKEPVAITSDGARLLIADNGNNRVLIYNQIPSANNASANLVIGQQNMAGGQTNQGGICGANTLNGVPEILLDNSHLILSDYGNSRILIYNSIPTANNADADIVLGQNSLSNASGASGAARLAFPVGLHLNNHNLLICDSGNNRVLSFSPPFYTCGISKNHALSGTTLNAILFGCYSADAPVVKLTNGSTDILATGVSVSASGLQISASYNFQVFPSVFDLQITQDGKVFTWAQSFFVLNPIAQPVSWYIKDLGSTWSGSTPPNPGPAASIAMADLDQDKKQELVIADQALKVYICKKNPDWAVTSLPQQTEYFNRLLVTDGNQDGYPELYAATSAQNVYQYAGASWTKTMASTGVTLTAMASGDADNDGRNEIYAGAADGHVWQIKCSSGTWSTNLIGNGTLTKAIQAVAVGDVNGDGFAELYAASADHNIYPFTFNNGVWTLGTVINTVSTDMEALIVGDGEGDGKVELYGANTDGKIYQFKWTNGAWVTQPIPVSTSPVYGLTISDADNDGNDEIYAACGNGHLYRVVKVNGTWQSTDMGNAGTPLYALTVGDGEGNNQFEAYAVGANGHIYQFKAVSGSMSTPTPTSATIIPQNYFKIFHSQVNPVHGEQARIRWTQPQAGPVHITIYNLLGDKVANPLEGQSFSAGEYHEIDWNGRTQKGVAAGSGVYIVLLESPGYSARGKIAVIK
jgi:hypothetical protein